MIVHAIHQQGVLTYQDTAAITLKKRDREIKTLAEEDFLHRSRSIGSRIVAEGAGQLRLDGLFGGSLPALLSWWRCAVAT